MAVLAVLWLLLSWQQRDKNVSDQIENLTDGEPQTLVSAIQPISDANADSVAVGTASGSLNFRNNDNSSRSLENRDLQTLKRRFSSANAAIEAGQYQEAVSGLEALTMDFPSVVEPYLNLASIYAERRQLKKARQTLLRGFEANPKAGLLFDHLKKVHGALAANSYKQALDTNSDTAASTRLNLARASTIVTQLDQSNQIAALEKRLQDTQSQAVESSNEVQISKIAVLETRLDEIRAAKLTEQSTYQQELGRLKSQLAEQSEALALSQTAEREALARVVRAEQEASIKIAEVTNELESQKELLLAAQSLADQQSTALAKAQQQTQALALRDQQREAERIRSAEQAAASVTATASKDTQTQDSANQQQEQQAIRLVQSWARAWSAQDVSAYVDHYDDNYSSSQSITRAQWLEQRQVRLTNKTFINVNVSSFKVQDLGSRFAVTFSQYYQSNTVDDTVIKKLVFDKRGDNWSDSKIISERLVTS